MKGVRPLPPVSVPVTVVDGLGVGISARSVTGIEVTAANAGAAAELRSRIEPDWSPACGGVDAVSVTAPEAPGARVSELADRLPNGCQVAVRAANLAGTGGPNPVVAIRAVHLPGCGSATWALP